MKKNKTHRESERNRERKSGAMKLEIYKRKKSCKRRLGGEGRGKDEKLNNQKIRPRKNKDQQAEEK